MFYILLTINMMFYVAAIWLFVKEEMVGAIAVLVISLLISFALYIMYRKKRKKKDSCDCIDGFDCFMLDCDCLKMVKRLDCIDCDCGGCH